MDALKRIPVREQDPKERVTNFKEVCLGYSQEEAQEEVSCCIGCKDTKYIQGYLVAINISGFIAKVKERKFEDAADTIAGSSVLPAVCGRICPQEGRYKSKCIRSTKDELISIEKLERFVADRSRENGFVPVKLEKTNDVRVAVAGFDPIGLTCAGDPAKMGCGVTILGTLREPNGMLTCGIPKSHLPKSGVVRPGIDSARELSVKIEINVIIEKSVTIDELMDEEDYKAIFIDSDTGLPRLMGVPGENVNGVFSANEYLTRGDLIKTFCDDYGTPIYLGKEVVVVGDGNVTVGAARTALRLGAEVHIVRRGSEAELPTRMEEVYHTKEEGIISSLLANPIEILADDSGWVKGMVVCKAELDEPDALDCRRPVGVAGSNYTIDVDAVITSLGASLSPPIPSITESPKTGKQRCIVADESNGKTAKEGIYAGNNTVTGTAIVTLAMEAGHAGARGVNKYFNENK